MKTKFTFSFFLLLYCFPAFTQTAPTLIKDINPGDEHSDPSQLCMMGDVVYFFANDGTNGIELWQTDGTEAGTSMVKNIGEGSDPYCMSTYGCGPEYIIMNDVLYFRASDNVHGAEIWRSDGTEAGTYMVKDINFGTSDCSNSIFMTAQYFTVMDDVLYFAADGGSDNIELWRSDGTETGTYLVKDMNPSGSSIPQYISAIDGSLYFAIKNASGQFEIWKSDGTESGTTLLKEMWVHGFDNDRGFFKYGDYIYFAGDDAATPYNFELWRTDGTTAGTQLFMELNSEEDDGGDPREFHIVNDKLVFSARPENDDVLMVTDGTTAGTVQLKDKNGDDFEASFYQLLSENKLYFQGSNEDGDNGLWITDGTDAGTSFLLAIESGEFQSYFATVVSENNIVYAGYDDNNGCKAIFQSSGTVAETSQMFDCDVLKNPSQIITYQGKVIMNASTEDAGSELWLVEPEFAVSISDDIQHDEAIEIFPNPSSDFLTVTKKDFTQNENIIITDAFGNIIKNCTLLSTTQSIQIDNLSAGIYFIKTGNSTSKFMKQ